MRFRFKEERQSKTISINSTLSLILEEFGLKESLIIGKVRIKWKDIVGDLMAAHSIPDRIFKNILFITVDHSVYANEISLMKEIIVKTINEEFGSDEIKDIRLETKKLDWQKLYPKNVKI
jgi:predicted nucleic acid-binding Zn ribbon protein